MADAVDCSQKRTFKDFVACSQKEAIDLCAKHLPDGKSWAGLKDDQIKLDRCVIGTSNTIYIVENLVTKAKVIFRMFGSNISLLESIKILNRSDENVCFYILGSRGCGPKLLSLIPDGRIEEYFHGHCPLDKDVLNDVTWTSLARKLCRYHYLNLDMPIIKKPLSYLKVTEEMVQVIESKSNLPEVVGAVAIMEAAGVNVREELEFLRSIESKIRTRVVFCHNDLHNANILVNHDDPSNVMILDMHMSSFGFRGNDIGSWFMYTLLGGTKPDLISGLDYPSRDRRVLFIKTYLDEYQKIRPDLYDEAFDSPDEVMKDSLFYGAIFGLTISVWVARDAERYLKYFPGFIHVIKQFMIAFKEAKKELLEILA